MLRWPMFQLALTVYIAQWYSQTVKLTAPIECIFGERQDSFSQRPFLLKKKINVKNMFLKQSSTFINEVCIIIANSIKNWVGLGGGGCLTNTIVIASYMYQNLTASISMFEQDIEPGRHWGCILINLYVYLGWSTCRLSTVHV